MRKPNLSEVEGRIGYMPCHEWETIMTLSGPREIGEVLIDRPYILRGAVDLLDGWIGDAFGTEEDRELINASVHGRAAMRLVWDRVENDFDDPGQWYEGLLAGALAGLSEHLPFGVEAEETRSGLEIAVKDHDCGGETCEVKFIEYPVCQYNEQHERDGKPAMYRAAFNPGGTNPTTYEYACEECAQVHGIKQCEEYKSY